MEKYSITVGGVDLRGRFGLVAERIEDAIGPVLRERKIVIPTRDGAYDFGAKYYNERTLTVQMASTRMIERADVRELSYVLSKKARIVRWDEPDKYYVGRIYDPAAIERIAGPMKRFRLVFVCDPFAYGEQVTEDFTGSANLSYLGTARTPTHITIRNNGSEPVTGIAIIMREAIEG